MELTIFDDRKELEAKAVVKFLCEYISNGGTLVDWCKEKNYLYSSVMELLRMRPEYMKHYSRALLDRDEYLKESMLNTLKDMMNFDPSQLYNSDGTFKPMGEMSDVARRMIKRMQSMYNKDGELITSVEFLDKQKALDHLGKYLGFFEGSKARRELDVSLKSGKGSGGALTLEETIANARKKDSG